ncbi:inositol monophosphatase family protein [Roseibium litorale]|uniref:Inositol monophosphatase family protein n=1 Tax=Roseibium litorale TaxID=2803841 RepID=A0ABR9CQS0_9HYPH|nr:inositol monophosphatase family protein [Roseibium litorale]MBD8892750.1 inositol monophosphatase family protein [Roseibium litorale]
MSTDRYEFAIALAKKAGELGVSYFRRLETLTVTSKGHQDMVSEADRDVEALVRDELAKVYPDDGILGEEHGRIAGTSGYTWVIDPIDGTANFVASIPQWCVIIACIYEGETVIGVIHDPVAGETFHAMRGKGAFLGDRPISVSDSDSLSRGSLGVGFNGRTKPADVVECVSQLLAAGGVFFRNASGGLMLAYTAAGRLIGYIEPHMNAWDCLAGLLMIEEAGGKVEPFDVDKSLDAGTRIVCGGPGIYDAAKAIADASFS